MAQDLSHFEKGYIISIQEERFCLITEDGRALLLTMKRFAAPSMADVRRWHDENRLVQVEYSGQPDMVSGVAVGIHEVGIHEEH